MSVDSASIEPQFNINAANSNGGNVYEFDDFRLDASRLMLYRGENEIDLAPKVVETLLALVENAGRIVSKEELFERVWKDSFVDESNLTQNIYLLRKTLGENPEGRPLIETFRRRGYRFNGVLKADGVDGRPFGSPERLADRPAARGFPAGSIPIVVGGAVLIVAVVAFGIWYAVSTQRGGEVADTIPDGLTFTRLTPGLNTFYPAISPDGKMLAYCLYEPTGHSLWVKNLSGERAERLTRPVLKSCNHPLFSPDGKSIFYLNERNALTRIPIAGGEAVELFRSGPAPFALSPDGQRVAFVRQGNLVVAAVDGSGERNVSERDGESRWYSQLDALPSWSPDGERIVLSGVRADKGRRRAELIEVIVANGAERIIPTPDWESIDDTAWSKDGSSVFANARDRITSPRQIWRIAYPTGTAVRITNDLQSYSRLTMTDDGRMLMTEKTTGACNIWVGSLNDPESFKQITFDDGEITGRSGLAIAPNGRILFTATYGGNQDIWQMDSNGGDLRQLTANTGDRNIHQRAANDGKYVVYASRAAGGTKRSIWRMDADGGNPVQLTSGPGEYPAVSPDGRWVYFTDISEKRSSIWKVSIDGGETFRVTGDYPADVPAVSPDGNWLAFVYGSDSSVADSGKLAIMRIDGGEEPKLFDVQPFRAIFDWSRDGGSILYLQKGSPNLWRQPIDGGPPSQVTSLGVETAWNFAVSPTSDTIAIARGNAATEAVLITNFR